MPDWGMLVRERLVGLGLAPPEEEVIDELADHLQEAFESFRLKGVSEQEAAELALTQVGDWESLRREIYLARKQEDIMEPRITRFWLPGLLGFALAVALLEVAERLGFRALMLSLDRGTPVLAFHFSWILALPVAGAIAAYASRRSGASLRTSLLSSVFPVVPFSAVFLGAVPLGLVVGHPISYSIAAKTIAYGALGWVVAPALALLAGGWLVEVMRPAAHQGGNACVD